MNKTCEHCLPGRFSDTGAHLTCDACPTGFWTTAEGAKSCDRCVEGKWGTSATACTDCPLKGVACANGILRPQNGFWTPAMRTGAARALSANATGEMFACLPTRDRSRSACVNATTGSDATPGLTTGSIFRCEEGHDPEGVLCAVCSPEFFFKEGRCHPCDQSNGLSEGAVPVLAALGVGAALVLLFRLAIRKNLFDLQTVLHTMKRKLKRRRRRNRRRHRERWRRSHQRRKRRNSFSAAGGLGLSGGSDDDDGSDVRMPRYRAPWAVRLLRSTMQRAHESFKVAKSGYFGLGESMRITLNCFKIITHLYGTLQCTSRVVVP